MKGTTCPESSINVASLSPAKKPLLRQGERETLSPLRIYNRSYHDILVRLPGNVLESGVGLFTFDVLSARNVLGQLLEGMRVDFIFTTNIRRRALVKPPAGFWTQGSVTRLKICFSRFNFFFLNTDKTPLILILRSTSRT